MNRLLVLFWGIVLLLSPVALLAQRGGHGAGGGRPSTGTSNPAPSNNDINDFDRAIALQATPEQIMKFQELTKSTEAARQQTQTVLQPAAIASKPDSSRGLNDIVEEAQQNNLNFVKSLSASQQ